MVVGGAKGIGQKGYNTEGRNSWVGLASSFSGQKSQFGSTGSRSEGVNGVGFAQVTDRKRAAHGGEPNGRLSPPIP